MVGQSSPVAVIVSHARQDLPNTQRRQRFSCLVLVRGKRVLSMALHVGANYVHFFPRTLTGQYLLNVASAVADRRGVK